MLIADNRSRLKGVKPRQIAGHAAKCLQSERRIEVADVLTDNDLTAGGDGERVFLMCADRQQRRQRLLNRHGIGSIAASATQDHLASQDNAHDGIIDLPGDGAIVNEENVGDTGQARQSLALVEADRLVAAVAAGGHDGKTDLGHQQMVQRRVRQHDAEIGIAGSHCGSNGQVRTGGTCRSGSARLTYCAVAGPAAIPASARAALPPRKPGSPAAPIPDPDTSGRTVSPRGACGCRRRSTAS